MATDSDICMRILCEAKDNNNNVLISTEQQSLIHPHYCDHMRQN